MKGRDNDFFLIAWCFSHYELFLSIRNYLGLVISSRTATLKWGRVDGHRSYMWRRKPLDRYPSVVGSGWFFYPLINSNSSPCDSLSLSSDWFWSNFLCISLRWACSSTNICLFLLSPPPPSHENLLYSLIISIVCDLSSFESFYRVFFLYLTTFDFHFHKRSGAIPQIYFTIGLYRESIADFSIVIQSDHGKIHPSLLIEALVARAVARLRYCCHCEQLDETALQLILKVIQDFSSLFVSLSLPWW